ncbi:uncharacterized protein LOC112571975 [Pomacea canaliculata]|uniref:uncharacterized protein LOC112571975 n=1 Tax=Pomacea canaliculata TaxID=400727 RepID=UPI000D72F1F2|nr:uncharacterized protein LOC112571975 [Pomacea canaliculata]
MWHKFEVTVRPGWNWKKTRSFFGHKGPRLYQHVRHLVINLDRRAQAPQTVDAPQANAVLSSVSKLLRALPDDMTLRSFCSRGFKYYRASKDWKSYVICELCKFLRPQRRFLEHIEITFENMTDEIIKTLEFSCPLLRRLTIRFDLSLQPSLEDHISLLNQNEVVDKNPDLRVVLWLTVGDSVYEYLMNESVYLIQLPVEGLVVDVYSLHTETPVVNRYLDLMTTLYGNDLTFLEWSCVVRGRWCYGQALVNLVNKCPRLASISLKNITLDLETATAISACSGSAERGKIKLRVGGICGSSEASSNAREEGIRQLKHSLDLQVVM